MLSAADGRGRINFERDPNRQRAGQADTKRVLDETPRFEIEVAGHLLGPRPAECVRERLLAAIKGTR